jgi:hypothetical protein
MAPIAEALQYKHRRAELRGAGETISKAKTMRVTFTLFHSNPQVVEFTVAGFDKHIDVVSRAAIGNRRGLRRLGDLFRTAHRSGRDSHRGLFELLRCTIVRMRSARLGGLRHRGAVFRERAVFHGRRFDPALDATRTSRELAVQWATAERKAIETSPDAA